MGKGLKKQKFERKKPLKRTRTDCNCFLRFELFYKQLPAVLFAVARVFYKKQPRAQNVNVEKLGQFGEK